jgi:ACR3 family arsenite efflux pump ArsB
LTRQSLEKIQVFIYLGAILSGLLIGFASPGTGAALESALWPILGLLLYVTFTQIPLAQVRDALVDFRFLAAAIVGNFVVLPVVVGGLMLLTPDDPAIRLGVLMVLLVPCTDWFITFTHLGGGDTKRAMAFSPVSLLLQIVLLPLYLWIFFGDDLVLTFARGEMLLAFSGLILAPLFAAFLTERWVERDNGRLSVLEQLAWFPVPLLAVVVLIIAATQVHVVMGSIGILGHLLLVFVAFLLIAGLLARLLARQFGLPPSQGRVLAFSLGTRNSFVVLPLALALPPSYELAVVAIVFQSLVELFGMVVYLWWVPQRLFPLPP